MAENKKILRIVDSIASLGVGQTGVEPTPDADLLFKMWGGRDADGDVTKWLAKGEKAAVADLTLDDLSGATGLLRHTTLGLVEGGPIAKTAFNALISDANFDDEGDQRSADAIQNVDIATAAASPSDGNILKYNGTSTEWELATDAIVDLATAVFVDTIPELKAAIEDATSTMIFITQDQQYVGGGPKETWDGQTKDIAIYGADLHLANSTDLVLANGTFKFYNRVLISGDTPA